MLKKNEKTIKGVNIVRKRHLLKIHEPFVLSFALSNIWMELPLGIHHSESLTAFENAILKIDSHSRKSVYSFCNSVGPKLLSFVRLQLSHPNEYKFDYNLSAVLYFYVA